jgi:branched-chain amino acid transport system substrate-binding protein
MRRSGRRLATALLRPLRPLRPPRALAPLAVMCALALALGSCRRRHEGIILGLYASMTGSQAQFGISTRNGIQLAVDEANAAGGVNGQRVRFVYEDDRGDSAEAVSAVSRLIYREGVDGLLGEIASSLSLSGGRVAQREHVPMVTPSSTGEVVTSIGDYIFRVCFIDPFQGAVMAHFAREQLHLQRVAIFIDQGSAYSTGLAASFRSTFQQLGGHVVSEQSYRASETHFSAQLGTMLAQDPQAVFVPGYYGEVALIGREARGLGFRGPLLGGDGWDAPELYQNDGDALVPTAACPTCGGYFSEAFAPEHPTTERGRHFIAAYQQRFHADANGLAALGYDAALVMLDAMRRAGTTRPDAVRAALATTRNFEGATGVITLNRHRDAVKGAVILAVEPNAFRYESAVAAPAE